MHTARNLTQPKRCPMHFKMQRLNCVLSLAARTQHAIESESGYSSKEWQCITNLASDIASRAPIAQLLSSDKSVYSASSSSSSPPLPPPLAAIAFLLLRPGRPPP